MHPPESKIAELLPRIVERAARRSDEKQEEPWVKAKNPSATDAPPVDGTSAEASFLFLALLIVPALISFLLTGVLGRATYPVGGAGGKELYCIGAPLVHTIRIDHLGHSDQFFAGALLTGGLMWIGIAVALWWSLHCGTAAFRAYLADRRHRFTIGQLLAISVGIAMFFSAWRWDVAANVPWHTTLAAVEKSIEAGQSAGPAIQPLFRFSFLAAGFAYLGVGAAGYCLASGGLWLVRQFIPRRPGEDKSLLQQIF